MRKIDWILFISIITLLVLIQWTPQLIHLVHAQTTSTVPELSPNPNLQFLPQRAYIITQGPNGQVATAVPVQSDNNNNNMTAETTGIIGILTAVATGLWAKFSATKEAKQDNRVTTNALLDTKQAQIDHAKYTFSLNPEKANALNDMPTIKLETLEQQKKDLQEEAVES